LEEADETAEENRQKERQLYSKTFKANAAKKEVL